MGILWAHTCATGCIGLNKTVQPGCTVFLHAGTEVNLQLQMFFHVMSCNDQAGYFLDKLRFTGGKRVVYRFYSDLRNKGTSGTYVLSALTVVVK